MGIIERGLAAILGLVLLILAGTAVWAFLAQGKVDVLQAEVKAVQLDLEASQRALVALTEAQKARVKIDSTQSTSRAKSAQAVRAVRDKVKVNANANDYHPASPAELSGLRELAAAGNAGIRAARELP